MIHLSTYNTNYGLKKSWESKCQFDSQPLKIENYPKIHACSGVPHIVGKLFTRATIFLLNSFQSEVFTSSSGCPKWQKSQLKEFLGLSTWESQEKWHLSAEPWLTMENIKKGEGGGFLKFGSWWVFWVHVCPWFIYAPKVFQLCINKLVV